jgi:hypothetical protein
VPASLSTTLAAGRATSTSYDTNVSAPFAMFSRVRCRSLTLDRDECRRQLHWPMFPGSVLSSANAVLFRVPLGLHPSLHPLAPLCSSAFSYFDGVRLLGLVHQRRRLLALPLRTGSVPLPVKPEISRLPCKAAVHELKGRGVALRAPEQPVDTGTGKAFIDMSASSPNSRPIYAARGNSRATAPRERADPLSLDT